MWAILSSDFFIGTMVGLLLSFVGGWAQAQFTNRTALDTQVRNVRLFLIDTIKNIQSIIKDLDEGRDRGKAIYHDYLQLIEIEVNIYGRNRESMIRLPDDLRADVRKFMSEVAIKRVEIVSGLASYYDLQRDAEHSRDQGDSATAGRQEVAASLRLQDAHKAADRMVKASTEANQLLDRLSKLKR